jgi:hypothetical protein
MRDVISNPYFQLFFGTVVGFAGSVVANRMFFGKMEKKQAQRAAQRAYNKLMHRLVHTSITDISNPLEILPVEIADRVEDLRFALEDVNRRFDHATLVQQAIVQAVELRKQQEALHAAKDGSR